jgi:hypothetical protein
MNTGDSMTYPQDSLLTKAQMNPAYKSSFPVVLDPVVAAVMAQLEEQVEAKDRVIATKDQIIAQSELKIQKLEEACRDTVNS